MTCLYATPWESRNLGVEAFAIHPDFVGAPDEERLRAELDRYRQAQARIFIHARIGKNDFGLNRLLERSGFYFVEQTVDPYVVFNKCKPLQNFQAQPQEFVPRRYDHADLVVVPLDKTDQDSCRQVEAIACASFADDRFHLDPNCTPELADQRFGFWVRDLFANHQVHFSLLKHREEVAGFMARQGDHLILAGLASKYKASGLGDYLWLGVCAEMANAGLTQAHTLISANNTGVLNLYARLGFKFRNPAVTFHYWG